MNVQNDEDKIVFAIKKSYLYVALALLIGIAGGYGVARLSLREGTQASDQTAFREPQQASGSDIDIEGRPYLGPEDAPVTIVEFTDYECPFCARHFKETLPDLLREYEGSIRYVILNLPIASLHPFAQQAGEAAECAHDQGRFWEYHDLLFQNQGALDRLSLKTYAREIELDMEVFNTCLDSGAKTQLVLDDIQDALSYGVSATPTFFINGQPLIGAQPFDVFQAEIDAALGG